MTGILSVMKSYIVLYCLLLTIELTTAEKQIKLEDIERDMLQSERKVKDDRQDRKLTHNIPPSSQYAPGVVTQAILRPQGQQKLQYGFVPVRTPEHYVHPPPHVQEQAKYAQSYVQPQYYAQQYQPQAQYQQQPQPQQQPHPQQQQYIQYENVPYIVDNSIGQQPQGQYYQPQQQYIYLQPYSSSSNNIHSVVDAKGNVQYVMYVPASYLSDKQLAEYENSVVPSYEQPQQVEPQQVEYQYVPESQVSKYAQNYASTQPQTFLAPQSQSYVTPQVQYAPEVKPSVKYTKVDYNALPGQGVSPLYRKKEPQSLLDSYVPSILQYQLYKQQQANSLRQSLNLEGSGRSYAPKH